MSLEDDKPKTPQQENREEKNKSVEDGMKKNGKNLKNTRVESGVSPDTGNILLD